MSLKIMVVDDEPTSLKLMRSLATLLNHTVVTFGDNEQARERADKQRFDAVFLGMRTPEPSGLELARLIRNSATNCDATIVMLSATDDIPSLRKAFGEGANFVLVKPITAARLRPMLAAMEFPDWKKKIRAARLPLFTDVHCVSGDRYFPLRSMNISESGMLLQPSVDLEEGQEVSLEFQITEVRATLNVRARIVWRDGTERVGVEFTGLAPEDQNSIYLYVLGRAKGQAPPEREGTRSIWMGHGFLK